MNNYNLNRAFTDKCHNYLINYYYEPRGYNELNINYELKDILDKHLKIDYCFEKYGNLITFQERCRSEKYLSYNDVTLRYNDDINKSEVTTILADYLLYAVIKGEPGKLIKGIHKLIIIDIIKLKNYIKNKEIIIGSLDYPIISHKNGKFVSFNIDKLKKLNLIKDEL